MDIQALQNEFRQSIKTALENFAKSEDSPDVYAMVLDCDSQVGGGSLGVCIRGHFLEKLPQL